MNEDKEREGSLADKMVEKEKGKANLALQRSEAMKKMFSRQGTNLSPSIRRAITNLRKELDKKSPMNDVPE